MNFFIKDDNFNRWVLRIINFNILLIFYIGFIWFADYHSNIKQVIGLISMFIGLLTIIISRKLLHIKYIFYMSLLFYGGTLFILINQTN